MSAASETPSLSDADILSILRTTVDLVETLHSPGLVTGQGMHCNACSAPERGYVVPYPCATVRTIWLTTGTTLGTPARDELRPTSETSPS